MQFLPSAGLRSCEVAGGLRACRHFTRSARRLYGTGAGHTPVTATPMSYGA